MTRVSVSDVRCVIANNPCGNRTMPLSEIDQRISFYTRQLLFYKAGIPTLADHLEAALRELLVSYDFCAGRLRFSDEDGRMEILCNNAGAFLALATAGVTLADLPAEDDCDDFFYYLGLDGRPISSLDDFPLVTLQITRMLGESGHAIGILIHHALVDATSAMNFLLNLASISRGDGLYMAPNADRTRLRARDPPRIQFEHKEFAKHVDQSSGRFMCVTRESVLSSEFRRKNAERRPRKTLFFSFEKLHRLKQALLNDGTLERCSTFEALASFVWRAHARSIPSKSTTDLRRLQFVVDTRNILKPPLGDNFCGNGGYRATAELTLEEMCKRPLSSIVACIQEAKRRLTHEYVLSGWDFLYQNPGSWYSECETMINSWPRLMHKAVGLDFGWGKPSRMEFPLDPRNPAMIFFPFNSDGITVSVCMDTVSFSTFESLAAM